MTPFPYVFKLMIFKCMSLVNQTKSKNQKRNLEIKLKDIKPNAKSMSQNRTAQLTNAYFIHNTNQQFTNSTI